jgi:hypothetical protein
MATPQLSPGVLVREVDLTVGRADNVLDNIGAIAGPFRIGPVEEAIDISTEQELINTFGKPLSTDTQYEYWMSAANFLSYGGVLKVVRQADDNLRNANAGVGIASTNSLKVYNYDDYQNNHTTDASFVYAAKNPGSWADKLKVCYIDDAADQIIGINTDDLGTAGFSVGFGVTAAISGTQAGLGTTGTFTGHLKGIITGVNTSSTASLSTIEVKIVSQVSSAGTETRITYAEGNSLKAFDGGDAIFPVNNSGINTGAGADGALSFTPVSLSVKDWYEEQTLGLTNQTIYWKTLAPKPETNVYVSDRDGRNDGVHIVVVDDTGSITGIRGNVLETHLSLSKASDAISNVNAPQRIYYKDYLADFSENIYAGLNPSLAGDAYHGTSPKATGFTTTSGDANAFAPVSIADGSFRQDAQGVTFSALGNVTYELLNGLDYTTVVGGMKGTLADNMRAYDLFSNKDEIEVDYMIMGPGCDTEAETQAKANKLISLANERKDCMAVIGPHRANLINVTNSNDQTNNLINYFSTLSSSSYAVFDSGYKYQFDRFNNEFRYVPANADVAGLMVRTSIQAFPWFSPAGQQRGVINNAVKLAYNPSKTQRDRLYPKRVNSFITKPGVGTLLFGDKTALGYASAFDRINVRRLFLTVEQALARAAEAQLFELNDELTRANFRNIVEPFLRDVQAKRGLYGFLVVCDSSNNTPDIIDNNEFRADIFLKPTKSINYITLTFVATRTGVSFEEVVGTV